eukprot:gene48944-biopygen34245
MMNLFGRSGFSHGDRIEAAGQPVRLSVNARARRISLRVDRVKREAIATAPSVRRLGDPDPQPVKITANGTKLDFRFPRR